MGPRACGRKVVASRQLDRRGAEAPALQRQRQGKGDSSRKDRSFDLEADSFDRGRMIRDRSRLLLRMKASESFLFPISDWKIG